MAAKVILVEPDEDERRQFARAVKGSAFEVSDFADTNAEALELYDKSFPHLIVLRLVSGRLGAAAALDKLHRTHPKAKVVLSYDVSSTHLLMAAYSHGAINAIKRPFAQRRVVEKLTFAIASEQHDKLVGAIVRLEHPVRVRFKPGSWMVFSRKGFCERLGLTDMDLNIEKPLKVKTSLKLELMLPPPAQSMKFEGSVEDIESTSVDNWRAYIALKNVPAADRRTIEAFLVRAARRI